MGYVYGPVFWTGGHIRMGRVSLLRQDVGDGVHGVDEVHEQRIDVRDDGHGNGDLEDADHVQFLSFRCSQYTGNRLRMCYGLKKNVRDTL